MRGSFALAVLSMVGAVGCGDASADIAASQHGKRLNLVNGESTGIAASDVELQPKADRTASSANAYRDFAGVVLATPTASVLHEWLLSADGTTLLTRACPVTEKRGADFLACTAWSAPEPVSSIGLDGPVRSFSAYLYPQADGSVALEEAVFDMSGGARSQRACAITDGAIDESACGAWTSGMNAIALGIPQERAFDDEVVISYVDAKGDVQMSQELVSLTGSQTWQRTCAASDTSSPCSFSSAQSLAELGIHYQAIEGIGGYTYAEGDQIIYAQTVIAPDGSAGRRLCPVSGAAGVELDKCRAWQSVELSAVAMSKGGVL